MSLDPAAPARPRPQRGRAASERALIDAAAELFVELGPNSVSVRAIADRAGVNHGLVHHYFGSKAGLVKATHEELTRRAAQAIADRGIEALFDPDDPSVRVAAINLARTVLDRAMPQEDPPEFPVMGRLIAAGQARGMSAEDASLRAAQVVALVSGWLLLESYLIDTVGGTAGGAERMRQELAPAILRLAIGS